mmetsp:Transcript_7824/g.22869  ORF Transcript_7824/g.22869 Transcript_7824/m.22869 type:complete len:224 (-) Transcript_7824:151-822(-)
MAERPWRALPSCARAARPRSRAACPRCPGLSASLGPPRARAASRAVPPRRLSPTAPPGTSSHPSPAPSPPRPRGMQPRRGTRWWPPDRPTTPRRSRQCRGSWPPSASGRPPRPAPSRRPKSRRPSAPATRRRRSARSRRSATPCARPPVLSVRACPTLSRQRKTTTWTISMTSTTRERPLEPHAALYLRGHAAHCNPWRGYLNLRSGSASPPPCMPSRYSFSV